MAGNLWHDYNVTTDSLQNQLRCLFVMCRLWLFPPASVFPFCWESYFTQLTWMICFRIGQLLASCVFDAFDWVQMKFIDRESTLYNVELFSVQTPGSRVQRTCSFDNHYCWYRLPLQTCYNDATMFWSIRVSKSHY